MTTVGFTRPTKKVQDSVKEAKDMGLDAIGAPSLDIESGDGEQFDLLESLAKPGAIVVFGSATAVEECAKHFGDRLPGMFAESRNIAIGPATKKALDKAGVNVTDVPDDYSSFGLVELLKNDVKGKKVVAVRSDKGNKILADGLRDAGAELVEIAAYKLTPVDMNSALLHLMIAVKRKKVDVMAFTSPLSAKTFFQEMEEHYGKEKAEAYLHDNVKVAAIGKPTAMMLESLGRPADIIPENTTFHDMLQAIKDQA